MYRTGWRALLLLLIGAALGAADDPKEKDKGKSDKAASAADEYKALMEEHEKAQQAIVQDYRQAKDDEERSKHLEKYGKLGSTYARRFLELAEKNPKDPVAVDALLWVVTNAEEATAAPKAGDLIVQNHLDNKKVVAILPRISRSMFPPAERIIRGVLEKSKDHNAQGQAWYALAELLKNKAENVKQIPSLDAKTRKRAEMMYGKDFIDQLTKEDPSKLQKEAEAAYERVAKDFADVKTAQGTLGDRVKAELFEIRHLAIGKEAMDIEGEDVDGKKFKLSDYRGKVVVIDFWGNW
jgi:hypothetical protein